MEIVNNIFEKKVYLNVTGFSIANYIHLYSSYSGIFKDKNVTYKSLIAIWR